MKSTTLTQFITSIGCGILMAASANAQVITTYAGAGGAGAYGGDGGPATAAACKLNTPDGNALDAAGNLYFADGGNNRVRMVNATTGVITTVAGNGTGGFAGDGGPATAATCQVRQPVDVAVDAAGNIYIADAGNFRIRKISTTGTITTLAGTGTGGPNGLSGNGAAATAAQIGSPVGIAVDGSGNVYFSSTNNHVRVINSTGTINAFAGGGGGLGDGGPATAANIGISTCGGPGGANLSGLFVDASNTNLYIADPCNNRVRKVVIATGIITSVAGTNGGGGYTGDGVVATTTKLNTPFDVALDATGNIYIADEGNNRIRRVNTSSIISTIVNNSGTGGYNGDNMAATAAEINRPSSISVKATNSFYISDPGPAFGGGAQNRIRYVDPDVPPAFAAGHTQTITVCENSTGTDITSYLKVNDPDVGQTETWTFTTLPGHGTIAPITYNTTSTGSILTPTGFVYTPTVGYSGTDVFTAQISDGKAADTTRITVTVSPLPVVAAITGNPQVCIGSPQTFIDVTAGGGWTTSLGNASVTSGGIVSGITAGIDTILYTVTNTCGTTVVNYPVSVNATVVPSLTISSLYGTVTCPGVVDVFTANGVNGGSAPVYQWLVNGFIVGSGGTSYSYVPNPMDVVSCVMTSNAICAIPSSVTGSITMDGGTTAVPGISITSSAGDTSCTGVPVAYTATIVNGGPTPTTAWTVNGAFAGAANPFIYTPANGDIIQCQLTSSIPCASPTTASSAAITMVVYDPVTPTLTITASPGNDICVGSDVTFAAISTYPGSAPDYTWTKNTINVATGPTYTYAPSNGDHVYCTMNSNEHCATSSTITSGTIVMSVHPPIPPIVNVVAITGKNIPVGGNDTLVATVGIGTTAPTYQWFVNGVAVPGATTSNFIYNGSASGSAIINCIVGSSDACGTTSTSNFVTVYIGVTSVKQAGISGSELRVSPNPNNGDFTMNMLSGADEKVNVTVTNILGEKVNEFTTTTNSDVEVVIGHVPGIYFLSASTAEGKYVAKVIVN